MRTLSLADEFERLAETLQSLALRLREAELEPVESELATSLAVSPGKLLLTLEETAQLLSLGKSTVYELVARKELPAVKRGKSLRFARQDIEAYVERLRRAPDSQSVPTRIRRTARRKPARLPGRVVG